MKEVKKNLQRFNKIAKETGSVTLFVLIAVLFFVVILLTVYTSSKNTLNAQEKEIAKIRAEYDITDSELDQAYSEKLEELNQDISITFTTATTGKTFHNTIDWTNENLKVGITFLAEGNPQNSKVVITDSTGTRTINCEVFLNGNNIIEKNCTIKVIASNGTTTTTTKTVKVSRIDKIKPIVEIEQKKQDFLIKKGTSVEVTAKINKAEDAAATQDSGSSGIKTLRYIWTTNQDVNQIVDPESKWQEISKAGDVTATFDGGEEKSNGEIKQTYYLLVEAIDNAGNSTKDILKDGITIEEDTKVPDTPSITNSSNGNWTNKDVTVILQSKDNLELSHFIVKKEDGTWEKVADAVNGKGTITYKDEMDKTFTYKAVDTSGNESGEMTTIVRIDKTNPTVPTYKAFYSDGSGNYTSGTWINKEVRTQITAKDNLSGTPGVHSGVVEMYYSTNKTQWTKFNLSISNGVQNDNTDNTIYTGTEKWDLKNRNDTYYFKVKDQAGNESEISTEFNVKYDIDKPTITVNPTNVNAVREANVAITVGDTGGSGLDSTNSYQYQISTSNTAVPTGTWLNYTSGAENTIGTGLTGTYYLWVKEIKDVVTNISQESGTKVSNYHVFGKYVFDNKAPTITFGTDGSTTYKKSQSTTVTATDNGEAGIDLNSLKYQWTQSTTKLAENTFTQSFVNGETITKNTGTGNNWYLWIFAKDKLGNTIITNSKVFYLDNTEATVTAPTASVTSNTVAVMFNQTDAHSGIDEATKQYGIRKKQEDGTWTKWSKWATDTQNTHLFKYTFEDEAGNTINITKNTEYEIRTQVTDKAGNGPTISDSTATKTDELNAPTIKHTPATWTNGNVTATISYPVIDYDGKEVTKQYSRDKGVTWTNTEENPQIITPITQNGTVWARIIDSTNQVSGTATLTIGNIDKLNPIVNSVTLNTTAWTKEDVTITGKATDAIATAANGQSGIIAYQFSKDGNLTAASTGWKSVTNTGANQTTQTQVVTENGIWYFYVKDAAGNIAKSAEIKVTNIDKTPPTAPTISVDSNYTKDGLVLQYDGRNNTGNGHDSSATTWKDLSGNNNDGNVEGGTWIENGLSLDGVNDRVVVPYNSSLAPNEYTIDIAIKKKAVVNNTRSILFVKWQGYTIELNPNNVTVFGVNSSTGYLATPSAQALNSDYTITATYKNNYQQLYINGLLVAEGTVNGSLAQTAGSLTIGAWGTSNYVNGDIYGVRMYNKALTDTDILKNYRADLATLEKYTGQDTQITITGGYALSGIAKYQYSTDNGTTWKDYNKDSKPTITAEGTTNVRARAVSNSQVEGETSELDVKIDKTNPVAGTMTMKINTATGETYNNNAWTNQNVYVSMNNGSDALSGHYQTTYSLDGGAATTTPQTITSEGTHTIIVTTIDNAGNKSTNTYTIKIDHNNPTAGTMTMKQENASGAVYTSGAWSAKNVYISMNNGSEAVTDKQSGHKTTTYTITGPVTSTTSTTLTNQTTARTLTNDGTYTITVITTDNAGNTATNSYTVKIDQTAPTGLALIAKYTNSSGATYSGAWTKENVYVTLTATDNSGSGIGNYEWYNGSTWTRESLTTSGGVGTITFTAERNTTIKFRVLDVLGNVSGEVSQLIKIDTTPITTTAPTGVQTSNTITATFKQTDTASGVDTTKREYAIKKSADTTWGSWQKGTEIYTFENLTKNTEYDIKTRGYDVAGNGPTESQVTTIKTDELDEPKVTATPTSWTNGDVTVVITYPNIDYTQKQVTKQYAKKSDGVDASGNPSKWITATANPTTFTVSDNDTIYARIIDTTNQTSGTASAQITNIDTIAPIINSLTPSTTAWTNGTVTITGKATDAVATSTKGQSGIRAYQFSTSGSLTATSSGWVAITNTGASQTTQIQVVTANATWYFYVKDAAGNVSKQSILIGNIDTTKPTAPTYEAYYTDGSGNYTSGTWTAKEVRTKITSTDAASGVSEIQYSTDKTNWTKLSLSVSNGVVSSKPTYYGIEPWTLQTRNNTYYFRVKDVAGNYSDASNAFNIRYDITAPTIATVTAGTDTTYKDAITFTASDNVNIASYGISTSATVQPTEWLSTTQLDLSGIETKTEYGATWAKVFYHNNVNGSELFTSDAEALASNSRYKYSILGQLENFRNTSGKFEFLLQYPNDTTGYNRWIQTDNPATTTIADGNSSATAAGYQAVHVDWTGGYWGGLTKSTQNSNTYIDGSIGSSWWYYAIGTKTKYYQGIPSYNNNGSDGRTQTVTELWVRVDNLTQSNKQNLTGKIGNITSNGTYYLWIKDHLGNVANKAVTVDKVDTTAPTISSLTANTTAWTNQDVTLTVAATDAESGLYATPYGWNQDTTWSAQATNTVSANGTYTTYVRNKIGNVSSKAITISNIDKTKPTVAFSPNGNTTYAKSQSTKVTVTDTASGVNTSSLKYQWTQSTTQPTEASFTTSFTNGGTITKDGVTGNNWYLWILAKDNAGTGNTTITRSDAFYLDNTVPSTPTITAKYDNASGSAYTSGKWTNKDIYIELSATDANSGIGTYEWYENGAWTTRALETSNGKASIVYTAERNETIRFRVKDILGNISGESNINIKIDKTNPTTIVPTGIATSSTITATFKQTDALSGINATTKKYAIKKTAESTWGAWETDSAATHKFTGLIKNTSYDIKTQVTDIAGNTLDSEVLTISTKDITSPEITSTPTSYTNGNVTVTIGYSDETYLTHKYYAKVNGESTASWHTTTANPTTFVIAENQTINAVSSEESQTSLTASHSVTNIDKLVPSSAGEGTVTAEATTLTLSISGATDAEATTANAKSGIKNYDFYIDGVLKATQTGSSYTFTGLTPNTSHTITWRARDNAGNVTTVSSSTTITKYTLVNTPTSLSATGGTTAQGQQITTTWAANGNAGTPTYELQASTDGSTFTTVYTGTALTYAHTGIVIGNNNGGTVQTRYYRLRVKNGDGVYSAYTANAKGNTLASPDVALAITSNGINSGTNNISLSWTTVTGASSYVISIFDGYTYRYKNIGNVTSWNSNDANIYPTSSQIEAWTDKSTDPFKWDGTGTDWSASANDLYVKANNGYTTSSYYIWIHVIAIDSGSRYSGGVWTGATTKCSTTLDTDAPNTFTPTTENITTNSITLNGSTTDKYMTASSSGSGIRGYTFSKDNGATWTAEQAGTSYTFTGLIHNTTYNLKMRAYDNNGNYVETSTVSMATVELTPGTIAFKKDNSSGTSFTPRTTTTGTKVWINSNVYMTQTNGNAGTTTYVVKNSAGTVQTITSGILTIPINTTDTYTVTVTTTDGTNTVTRTYYIDADKKAPTGLALTAKYTNSSGAVYSGVWTKENVYVTLTATDNSGSGIGSYEWYNGSTWTRDSLTTSGGVGTITFTAERNTTIRFRVLDALGNVSGEVTQLVKIDKTPITKTAPTLSETSSTITATFKQTDTASGVDTSRREYGIKESSSSTWKWESEATGENGQHKFTGLTQEVSYDVKTRGYDIAGNGVTESDTATVQTIKITQPIISTNPTAWTNGNVTVTITYPEETYLTHKYYAKVNGESTASWHTTTANPTTFVIDENQTINAVSVEGAQTSLTASRQVTNIDKIAPTIETTQESNIDADFSKWTLSGGAYVDSSGQLVLPSGSASAVSPFMPVDEKAWIMDVDVYATTASTNFTPNGGAHMGQSYYDSSYNSIVAPSNGYSANGWAEVVPLNTITHKTINGANGYGYGSGVKYVRISASVGSSYSVGPVTYSNFKFTTYGQTNKSKTIKVTATDNASGISAIKWLAGTKTIADFASAGTDITSTKQFEVTANGTYTIYAKDKAGNQTVKVETVSGIDRIAPTITVSPSNATATPSKSIAITAADTGGSGLAGGNSYQYQLSTSSTTAPTGTWTTYTSGTATTIGSGLNGKYYLWVKEIRDGVSNVSTTSGTKVGAYHVFGSYVFDNTKPTWAYISKTNATTGNTNNIKKADTITITFKGTDTNFGTSSLAVGDITVKIGGVTASPTTKTLSSATSISGGVQYTLTLAGLSGNGDLTFDIAAGKLTDAAGNTSDAATGATAINPSIYVDNIASHWEITDITINKR